MSWYPMLEVLRDPGDPVERLRWRDSRFDNALALSGDTLDLDEVARAANGADPMLRRVVGLNPAGRWWLVEAARVRYPWMATMLDEVGSPRIPVDPDPRRWLSRFACPVCGSRPHLGPGTDRCDAAERADFVDLGTWIPVGDADPEIVGAWPVGLVHDGLLLPFAPELTSRFLINHIAALSLQWRWDERRVVELLLDVVASAIDPAPQIRSLRMGGVPTKARVLVLGSYERGLRWVWEQEMYEVPERDLKGIV